MSWPNGSAALTRSVMPNRRGPRHGAPASRPKQDISTRQRIGHFYLALTRNFCPTAVAGGGEAFQQPVLAGISVLAIPPRAGYSNPRLGCKIFVLLSRSMLRSLPFRSLNAARSPCSSSLEGFSPTLLRVVPSSAIQRLLSVAARRPLTAWHRQRPDPPQHLSEQLAVEMPLGQQQPVIPSVLEQPPARLH